MLCRALTFVAALGPIFVPLSVSGATLEQCRAEAEDIAQCSAILRQPAPVAGEPKIVSRGAWFVWYANYLAMWAPEAVHAARAGRLADAEAKLARVKNYFERGLFKWSTAANTIKVRITSRGIEAVQVPKELAFAVGIRKFLMLEAENGKTPVAVSVKTPWGESQEWPIGPVQTANGRPLLRRHVFALKSSAACADALKLAIQSGKVSKTISIPLRCEAPAKLTVKIADPLDPDFPCARVAVKASDGDNYVPSSHARTYFWGPEFFAYVKGELTFEIPAGPGEVLVEKGFHHKALTLAFEAKPGEAKTVEARLEPLLDIYKEKWIPGMTHLHFGPENRLHDGFSAEEELPVLASGEGLSVFQVHALQDGPNVHSNFLPTGRMRHIETDRLKFDIGEEMRNDPPGHLMFINIKKLVVPVSCGALARKGSSGKPIYDFPTLTDQSLAARAQGGLVFAAHGGNSCEFPSLAAHGLMDGINFGDLSLHFGAYDNYLESGCRVPMTAGPDFEYVNGARVYVYAQNPAKYESWLDGLRMGRSFVTQGPLVFLEVEGKMPGATFEFDAPRKARVKARALSRLPYGQLQLVMNSKTIATAQPDAARNYEAVIDQEIAIFESGWLSARCEQKAGDPIGRDGGDGEIIPLFMQRAATSPIYFTVGGKKRATAQARDFLESRIKEFETFQRRRAVMPDDKAGAHVEKQMQTTRSFFGKVFSGKN